MLYSQAKMGGKNCIYNKGVSMKYVKFSKEMVLKTQNVLAKYPAKYHFSVPIRQEMLYKEYWNV